MSVETIVFITGLSGSGKSTVAQLLVQSTGYVLFSVGKFQREWASQNGYDSAVEFNKKEGLEKAYFSILPEIVKRMRELARTNKGIIVEGLYSQSLFHDVQKAFPNARIHIFNLTTNSHTRVRRYSKREKIAASDAKKFIRLLDRQKRKIGLTDIQQMKGSTVHVIPNKGNLSDTLSLIRRKLRRRVAK